MRWSENQIHRFFLSLVSAKRFVWSQSSASSLFFHLISLVRFSHVCNFEKWFRWIMRWFHLINRLYGLYGWNLCPGRVKDDVTKMLSHLATKIVCVRFMWEPIPISFNVCQSKWANRRKKWCSIVRKQNRKLKQNRVVFFLVRFLFPSAKWWPIALFRIDDEENAYFF